MWQFAKRDISFASPPLSLCSDSLILDRKGNAKFTFDLKVILVFACSFFCCLVVLQARSSDYDSKFFPMQFAATSAMVFAHKPFLWLKLMLVVGRVYLLNCFKFLSHQSLYNLSCHHHVWLR